MSFNPTPTGNGIPVVVSGVQSAAASLGTALQVLRTNAGATAVEWATPIVIPIALTNLDASAGTDGQILTRMAGAVAWSTNVSLGSSFITFGSGTMPATGTVRLPYVAADTIIGAKDSGGTDRAILQRSSADTLRLGHQTAYNVGVWAAALELWGGAGGLYLEAGGGGTVVAFSSGTSMECGLPRIGYAASLSPYGDDGVGTQAMADANQTLAASVYKYGCIKFTGAITANRTATVPAGGTVDTGAYYKPFNNTCTGAFGVVVSTGAGTTVTIANGKSALVLVDSRGVTRLTADV